MPDYTSLPFNTGSSFGMNYGSMPMNPADYTSQSPMNLGGAGMMQNFQQGVTQTTPGQDLMRQAMEAQKGKDQMEMYKMAAGALQNLAPRQQMPSGNTAQIMRNQNQFRFAGMQQNPQMLAQALRNRG